MVSYYYQGYRLWISDFMFYEVYPSAIYSPEGKDVWVGCTHEPAKEEADMRNFIEKRIQERMI